MAIDRDRHWWWWPRKVARRGSLDGVTRSWFPFPIETGCGLRPSPTIFTELAASSHFHSTCPVHDTSGECQPAKARLEDDPLDLVAAHGAARSGRRGEHTPRTRGGVPVWSAQACPVPLASFWIRLSLRRVRERSIGRLKGQREC